MSTLGRARRNGRNGRRRRRVLDLNVPPVENLEQAGSVQPATINIVELDVDDDVVHQPAELIQPATVEVEELDDDDAVHQPAEFIQPETIDIVELDDDVLISSLRAFEEAKNSSRKRTLVVDGEAEEVAIRLGLIQANKRRRCHNNPPIINCELYVNLEGSCGSMRERAQYIFEYLKFKFLSLAMRCMQLRSLQLSILLQSERAQYILQPPKELTFNCPVCLSPIVEEVTTKCGHIFCKACITAAIRAQHKCPTCRRSLTNKKNLIRVYLPTTN